MGILEQFSADVERYLSDHGMSAAAFGREFMSDPSFVYELRKGRSVRAETIDRLRRVMSESAAA